jgi:ribonuclease-3
MTDVAGFEDALGHRFEDPSLLRAALVHRSYAAENEDTEDNERLEFLGDAVLQMAVTDHLFGTHAELAEGQMAKVRAAVVNRGELALVARDLGLGDLILIGTGEEASGGREKDSILADAMEAVLAGVYLDSDYETARRVVLDLWTERIERRAETPGGRDFKTRYQEILAADGLRPEYTVEGSGPDHAKVFAAEVRVSGRPTGSGTGRSKKEAEQEAARDALRTRGVLR